MNKIRLLAVVILFFTIKLNAQTCTVAFTYSVGTNDTIVFYNQSFPTSAAVIYTWVTGNGHTYTTSGASQTVVVTTFTANGTYSVTLSSTCGITSSVIPYVIPNCSLTANMAASNLTPSSPTVNFLSLSTGTIPGVTYKWNFGDNTTTVSANPTHIYTVNGAYPYTLTAINNATCASFVIARGLAPYYPLPLIVVCGNIPKLSYTVNGAGATNFSVGNIGPGWSLSWFFGDGTSTIVPQSAPPTQNHVYFNGTYYPYVTMTNTSIPCTVMTADTVFVSNDSCYANSAFTYTSGAGGQVQFSKTAAPTNSNLAYYWYFGDGVSSSLMNPNHTYASAGNYTVTCICYDLRYPINSITDTIPTPCSVRTKAHLNITGAPCTANANFTIFPSAYPPNYFLTMTYPYNFSAVLWSWGDGSTSNTLYANHYYATQGNYNICLTVTTSCGATSSHCMNLYLSAGQSGPMVYINVIPSQISNGIVENGQEPISMDLYPNPCNEGLLNLRTNKAFSLADIVIDDLCGKRVFRTAVVTSPKNWTV